MFECAKIKNSIFLFKHNVKKKASAVYNAIYSDKDDPGDCPTEEVSQRKTNII